MLLKIFIQLGVKVTKISQVIKFDQEPWMRPYIETNNEIRREAQVKGIKSVASLAKLMNNSVFGKTMENVKKRSNVKIYLTSDHGGFEKQKSSVRFVDFKKITNNLVALHMKPFRIGLNKPIYIGQAILDISKVLMYDFYYNILKRKYNDKMKMIYTDTDSLIIKFETENIYSDLEEFKDIFDNSETCRENLIDSTNMKVPGKFKDETKGIAIKEVVALGAKSYSYITVNDKEDCKAKGIKKANIKKDLNHEIYKDCLFNSRMDMKVTQYNIESKNHELGVYEHVKTSLTAFDSKKIIYEDKINCYPLGYALK